MANKTVLVFCLLIVFTMGLLLSPQALAADELTLDSPNGNQSLTIGSVHKITWHLNVPFDPTYAYATGGSANYRLEYSTDSGATFKTIKEVDYTNTSLDWTVPDTPTSKARVKITLIVVIKNFITQKYDTTIFGADISNSDFTIANKIILPVKPPVQLPIIIKPAAPSQLDAEVVSADEIEVSWQDNSTNETSFVLERSSSSNSSYKEIATLAANQNAYTDEDTAPLTKYYYRVKAVNSMGCSAYSNEASATTPPLAQPPQQNEPQQPQQPQQPPSSQQTIIKFYLGSTDYLVNEQLHTMDASPVSIDGRTMLPIKYVAQHLGAATAWEPASQKVTVTLGSNVLELRVGNNTAKVNGQDKLIDPNNPSVKPVILPPGRTMLPLRFIGENLGCQVDWAPAQMEAKLSYPKSVIN